MTRIIITIILLNLLLWTSCYKKEEEISPSDYTPKPDSAVFTITGGGFNETISTKYAFQSKYYDPSTNTEGSRIGINDKSPKLEIYLVDHLVNTYTINGNENRAYLYTDTYVGDAFSGTFTISKREGTVHYEGSYDLSFRDNAVNPTDTIYIQGTYKIEY